MISSAAPLSPLSHAVSDVLGSSLERIQAAKRASMSPNQVDATAKDFESMFLSSMLENMFGDSTGDDAFGDSDTNEVYRGLMMTEYGKKITEGGGIGIADYVKRELLKAQEV